VGLAPSSISTLLVEGDNRPGLGHAIAKAIGDAGINMSFVIAQVVGRRYSAVFGFENEADASKAYQEGHGARREVVSPFGASKGLR
jgi:hypothetical protein